MLVSTESQAQKLTLEEEAQFVTRAQQRDADALGVLYRAYAQVVYRYVLLRVQNTHIAEDLTGEIFLKMVESLHRYKQRGKPFGAWLMKIAHDQVVDYYRRQKRRPVTVFDDTMLLPADETPPDEAAEKQEAVFELYRYLAHLSEKQQVVLQYRFIEGWSLIKTATTMKISVNAVKALQHRALRVLNQRMKNERRT